MWLLTNKFAIIGIAFALLGAWGGWNRHQFNAVTAEYEEFKVGVKAAGIAAQQAADARKAADKANQEKANAENAKTIAGLHTRIASLRSANPSGNIVPAAPASAKRPDLIAYDRAEYIGATGELVTGLRKLADEGSEATVNLNTAKTWALMMDYRLPAQ